MKVLNKIIYLFCVLCYTLSISGQIKSGVILFERKTNLLKKYKTPESQRWLRGEKTKISTIKFISSYFIESTIFIKNIYNF